MADVYLCRLCAVKKDIFIGIYDKEGHTLKLETKITKCLQIELYPKDPLPKTVCLDCCAKLNQYSDFLETTSQAQMTLRMIFPATKEEEEVDTDEQMPALEHEPDHESSLSQEEFQEQKKEKQLEEQEEEEEEEEPEPEPEPEPELEEQLYNEYETVDVKMEFEELEHNQEKQVVSVKEEGHKVQQQDDISSPKKDKDVWEKYPWKCTDCSQELSNMHALRTHHETEHNQPPRFMCAHCSKVYVKYNHFVSHIQRHGTICCCEECGKCFTNMKDLESHRATHLDSRPFVCSLCGKTFRQQRGLQIHNLCHQPEDVKNKYPCDQCDKRTTSKYVRKTERKLVFTQKILDEARRRIANGESQRRVAILLGTKESTLRKRLKAGTIPFSLGRFKPVFSPELEEELANHIREMDKQFYGITRKQLRQLAYEFAEQNNIAHRFNKKTKLAGKTWVLAFCKRQRLTLRVPKKCSLGRAREITK